MPHQLTVRQVAVLCAVEPGTVRRWIVSKKLTAARLPGGNYRVSRQDLEAALHTEFTDEQVEAVKQA